MSSDEAQRKVSDDDASRPSAMSRVRVRRRQRILDSAHRTFLRDGFHAATMERIAEDAGISKQTLYNYFNDKDELFIVLLEERRTQRIMPAVAPALDELGGEDIEAALQRLTLALLRNAANPDLAALYRIALELATERPAFVASLRERVFRRNHELAMSALQRAVEQGTVRDIDIEVAAAVLSGVVASYGLVLPVVQPELYRKLSPERMAAGLADLLGHGLVTRDAAAADTTITPEAE